MGSRRTLRNRTGGWTTAKSVAQEGRKVKPILPMTPSYFIHRKTTRTDLTNLKSTEDFFFSLFPPFPLNSFFHSVPLSFFLLLHPSILYLFYSFFLPSFTYSVVLIFVKIPSYLASDLSLFLLPSFLSFSIPFSFLPFSFYFFLLLSPFATGETIKPGAMKTPELDPVRPINVSSRSASSGD